MPHHCKDYGQPHEHAHGTTSGWSYHGCRCEPCRESHYAYRRAKDVARASNPERLAANRRRAREMRKIGHPSYADHGDSLTHSQTGWAAARRYREANRDVINTKSREKAARLRVNVSASPKRWWTPDEDAFIQQGGVPLVQLAYHLNRTPAAIAQRRHKIAIGAASVRFSKSDDACIHGHLRSEYGYRTARQWICRACRRTASERYRAKLEVTA